MDAVKFQIKVPFRQGTKLNLGAFIPVFHEWIKQETLGELLIDVADYSHVHHGPAVLLTGHESDYAIDQNKGVDGLLYSRKRDSSKSATERLSDAFVRVLRACRLLEAEPAFQPALRFDPSTITIRINDRLSAPDSQAARDAFRTFLEAELPAIAGSKAPSVTVQNNPRELTTASVTFAEAPSIDDLLASAESVHASKKTKRLAVR